MGVRLMPQGLAFKGLPTWHLTCTTGKFVRLNFQNNKGGAMKRALVLALALLAGAVPGLFAQIAGGNIYGNITDESGAVLPGAVVTVSSDFGTRTTTAGSQGEFRFLNLERGRYKVGVALAGFTSVTRDLNVVTGENVNLAFSLKVASH